MTGESAGLAERAAADAKKLLVNVRRSCTAPDVPRPNARLRRSRDPSAGRRRCRGGRALAALSRPTLAALGGAQSRWERLVGKSRIQGTSRTVVSRPRTPHQSGCGDDQDDQRSEQECAVPGGRWRPGTATSARCWCRRCGKVLVAERPQGRFARQLQLGENLDTQNVEARYANGVLHLTIPVAEAAQPRRIEVQGAGTPQTIDMLGWSACRSADGSLDLSGSSIRSTGRMRRARRWVNVAASCRSRGQR